MDDLDNLKFQLVERLIFQLRNHMQSILAAVPLLTNDGLGANERESVASIVNHKVHEVVDILTETQKHLTPHQLNELKSFPVEACEPLLSAITQLHDTAQSHEISFDSELPELISLAFAMPERLEILLRSILITLLEHVTDSKEISIQLKEREGLVLYTLKHAGIELTDDEPALTVSNDKPEFQKVLPFLEEINEWGGQLIVGGDSEQGLIFELQLKSFL
ncbi:MAG: hypothetical protein AAF512_03800 [Pseudomonadota bacterium]